MNLHTGQKIGRTRYERIVWEVAPMACRGATCEEISKKLGISLPMAKKDLSACFEIWHERYFEEAERWRPLMTSRYEMLFREAINAWESTKEQGRPNTRCLDSATRILGDLAKMLGLAIDVNLNQTNIAIGASSSTAAALAPLDVAAYTEMLASGSLGELNAVPPFSRQLDVLPA